MDTSSSISQQDFEAAKQFIVNTTSIFDVTGRTRVALITYSTTATIRINWGQYRSHVSLNHAINALDYTPGGTETAKALNLAREQLFSRARPNAVKSHDTIDTNNAARLVHQEGDILVLAVGVGDLVELDELHNIASSPACKHTFQVAAYDQIDALREEIQQITCRAPLILGINQTVTCAMCHCSPYAVPIPLRDKIRIESSTTCSHTVHVYTDYNNAYPSSSRAGHSMSVSRSSPNSMLAPTPGSNNQYYYLNMDQRSTSACSSGCTITLTPRVHASLSINQTVSTCSMCPSSPHTERIPHGDKIGTQVTRPMYDITKSSAYLEPARNNIQTHLGINWEATSWTDLLKPLYSGLAAALYISNELHQNPAPTTISQQQTFWATQYHHGGCQSQSDLDLAFIMDTSSSISQQDFEAAKQFIIDTTNIFDVAGRTRVALITYSTTATIRINWGQFRSHVSLNHAINGLDYTPGGTETALALNLAREQLFSRARPNAVKVLVLVTDGQSHDTIDTNNAARLVHQEGDILVLAVGVGDLVDLDELHNIASSPACKHTFRVAAYDQIDALRQEIQQITCRAPLILGINQTVTCAMCHCSPYAVPIPLRDKIRIESSTTCSHVYVYTDYNNAYPSSSRAGHSMSVSRSSPNSMLAPTPGSNNQYYYVNIDQTSSSACSSGCTITLTPRVNGEDFAFAHGVNGNLFLA
nr:hypothetical protein BaRGS_032506 [Batillaria attramentaria]